MRLKISYGTSYFGLIISFVIILLWHWHTAIDLLCEDECNDKEDEQHCTNSPTDNYPYNSPGGNHFFLREGCCLGTSWYLHTTWHLWKDSCLWRTRQLWVAWGLILRVGKHRCWSGRCYLSEVHTSSRERWLGLSRECWSLSTCWGCDEISKRIPILFRNHSYLHHL